MNERELLAALRTRVAERPTDEGDAPPFAPLAPDAPAPPVPPLLRRVCEAIGNGGWGPGYGLYALTSGVVPHGEFAWSGWAKTGALTQEGWPASWLLLAYWGCDVHSVLDLDTGRVGLCDLDAVEDFEAPGEALLWQTPDLSTWLRAWAQGESLFFDMAGEG